MRITSLTWPPIAAWFFFVRFTRPPRRGVRVRTSLPIRPTELRPLYPWGSYRATDVRSAFALSALSPVLFAGRRFLLLLFSARPLRRKIEDAQKSSLNVRFRTGREVAEASFSSRHARGNFDRFSREVVVRYLNTSLSESAEISLGGHRLTLGGPQSTPRSPGGKLAIRGSSRLTPPMDPRSHCGGWNCVDED